jgi:hypothetical protein
VFQRAAGVDTALDDIRAGAMAGARGFAGLRAQTGGAFSKLRDTRLETLREIEGRAIGGLRETLRQRRLGGSSFEALAVGDERERFARLADEITAESTVQDLAMTRQLLDDEFRASMVGLEQVLNQFNFETQVSAILSNSANALQQSVVASRAALAQAAAGVEASAAEGFGQAIQPAIDAGVDVIRGIFE